MISLKFCGKILIIPFVAIRTTIEYYTTGTSYSNSCDEFANSFWTNLIVSIEQQFVTSFTKEDLRLLINNSATEITKIYKDKVKKITDFSNHYGTALTDESIWLVRSSVGKSQEHVLMYYHGGGYAIGLMNYQFLGLLALYWSLPVDVRTKTSIVILDYPLTANGNTYPSQIISALETYEALVKDGVSSISLIGDSAGANLALVVNRLIAYPEEALRMQKELPFNVKLEDLPQPKLLILISPWVEPTISPVLPSKYGWDGKDDMCAPNSFLGDWYVEGVNLELTENLVNFTNSTRGDWSKIEALRFPKRTLVICGEKEVLREGIERWVDIVDKERKNIRYVQEKGGLHDCLFQVESVNFGGSSGLKRALNGDIKRKFCFNTVRDFLVSDFGQS